MEKTIKINRRLVIVFLVAIIVYLFFDLYQEVKIEFDWFVVVLQLLTIGIFIWSIFMEHLKKLDKAFEVSLGGLVFFIGLLGLLVLVSYLVYY